MNTGNLAKGLLSVPAVTTGVDLVTQSQIGETVGLVAGATSNALEVGNSLLNPLLSTAVGGASAGLVTNSILKEFKWMEDHKKTRWLLSLGAGGAGLVGGSVAAPYIATGSIAYWAGKHGWKYGKEAIKRGAGVAWGLTGGAVKGAVTGAFNSTKAGLKGEQKLNPIV